MKDTILNTREAVLEYLNDQDDNSIVTIHNQYCENANYMYDYIYYNDANFFADYFSDTMEAVKAVCFGAYKYQDEYVQFNGYANLETSNNPTDFMDLGAIADDILECPETYDIELEEGDEDED